MTRRKILPPTYLYGAIGLMVALHLIAPITTLLDGLAVLTGLIPLVIGVVINLLADRAFKQHATTVKPFEQSSALVTGGVFRFSRNPMYTGFVLGLVGIALLLGSLSPWLVVIGFVPVMETAFIRAEEAMLEQRFGEAFRAYQQQTRRWL